MAKKKSSKKEKKSTKKDTKGKGLPFDFKKAKPPKLSPKVLTITLVIIALALLVFKFGPWFVPAVVNNKPITRFAVYNRMEKAYGEQTLNDIINEKILQNAIDESGVNVSDKRVQQELDKVGKQFESLGGLDQALAQRGMTRQELEKQIRTQLAVEKILSDEIQPTNEEIQQEYEENQDSLYEEQALEEAKGSIIQKLRQSKLQQAFLDWFSKVKKEANVKRLNQ